MRNLWVAVGVLTVVAYAVWGAVVMNNLGLAAGSGLPLEETLAEMERVGERASMIPGYVFAILGIGIAAVWAGYSRRYQLGAPTVLLGWCAALALGAPAFFMAGFGNFMSLGDTFYDWDAQAVFALEAPLYLISAGALMALLFLIAVAVVRRAAAPRKRGYPRARG